MEHGSRLLVVVVLSLALGCSFNTEGLPGGGGGGDGDGSVPDAPPSLEARQDVPDTGTTPDLPVTVDLAPDQPSKPDIKPDTAIVCTSWTPAPAHFKPCDVGTPKGALTLKLAGTWTYNTDTGWLTNPLLASTMPQSKLLQVGGISVRFLSVTSLAVNKGVKLRVVGTRPLGVAAWSSITVNGTIDVSSTRDLVTGYVSNGAGADPGVCSASAPTAGKEKDSQGGGGGGGGFGDDGGDGGDGNDGSSAGGSKGSAVSAPSIIRGGCGGAKGGVSSGGNGGPGGGALQLTARLTITIDGVLHAGGGGGATGGLLSESGGGGGGSGGYLGLEAPTVSLASSAVLAANGGGGGGGVGDGTPGTHGGNGPAGDGQAAGGVGGLLVKGGAGGPGGHKGSLTGGPGKKATDGGGGGGGGAGHLVIVSSNFNDNGATISAKAKTP
jgi:hypothetical protein